MFLAPVTITLQTALQESSLCVLSFLNCWDNKTHLFQAALDNHQTGFTMSMFHTSSLQHSRFPAFKILRWFGVHKLLTVFNCIDVLGPAAILACTEDLTDPHDVNSYFSHSSRSEYWLVLQLWEDEWSHSFQQQFIFAGIRFGLGMSSWDQRDT